ncbi:hypothetical protein JOB18_026718 [Solea senegalensis]|uniref:Uncharacterized protein n=1 Tax=Solea senegalensis TaxID=28829 RepID=A0AAV6QHR3_SOLSE|nr:hypothetical protein JOB18_026718 [Solea senegalensis]
MTVDPSHTPENADIFQPTSEQTTVDTEHNLATPHVTKGNQADAQQSAHSEDGLIEHEVESDSIQVVEVFSWPFWAQEEDASWRG